MSWFEGHISAADPGGWVRGAPFFKTKKNQFVETSSLLSEGLDPSQNTPYIAFAILEQLFSLTNNRNVETTYKFRSIHKTLLKFDCKIVTSARHKYCSLKTVQEQAQDTKSIKCGRVRGIFIFYILNRWSY